MNKYYRSHGVLTLLHIINDDTVKDNDKVELFCNILTGQSVDWTKEISWVYGYYDEAQRKKVTVVTEEDVDDSGEVGSVVSVVKPKVFKRERRHGKSEFDIIEQMSKSFQSCTYSGSIEDIARMGPGLIGNFQSIMINVQLSGKNVVGTILGNFWKSIDRMFVENMEDCFFHRRIVFSEQEPFVRSVKAYLDKILNKPNVHKFEVVQNLQSTLFDVPNGSLANGKFTPILLSTLSDVKSLLVQLTNVKIEKCRAFVENEPFVSWFDKQTEAMTMVYWYMVQNKVRITRFFFIINRFIEPLTSD